MDVPVSAPELESNLADLRDLPLGEVTDPMVTMNLADRIMPQTDVSAFNSSI
jgi:hypothetical protein